MIRRIVTSLVFVALPGAALAQAPATTPPPATPPQPVVTPDDLAQAADATAEVAGVPQSSADPANAPDKAADVASTPAGAPASKPSSDDIDLAALGLDPAAAAATDEQLAIYGFADLTFQRMHLSSAPPVVPGIPVGPIPTDAKTFALSNLNVYLAKNLNRKSRALTEVRFTFMPNGNMNADNTITDTTSTNPADGGRTSQWGGIVIERAYAEYDVTDHLTIRGGRWLTPYGIWIVDHGSPVIISVARPYIIEGQYFPEHQTGLDLFGSHSQDGYQLGYHLTVSNGRGGSDAQQDQDTKFAFGGRLELTTSWGLRAGASYYRGRYTGLAPSLGATAETYLERAYAADVQFDQGGLHMQGEVLAHDRHYEEGMRIASGAGFIPDGRDIGGYVLAGYRFDQLWHVMPFGYYQYFRPGVASFAEHVNEGAVGFNFHPTPSLVLKAMGNYVMPSGGALGNSRLIVLTSQACWVF